ncbi:MAG TPA: AbrB/MazE/SpoVT family DNA-binding domain-containing protein [Gaiellaceae bacterium]|nr:AbrB/MazE/SpoVT family DNA-binding domain-containing protein [Gaiellaceae bacterium]
MPKKIDKAPECCGFSKVNTQGQMTIPAEARKALGLDPDTRLMVFTDRAKRRLLVTLAPPDSELLDLATPKP